jgi:hypothetical protein
MRAARIGAQDYRRPAHLSRLLGYGTLPPVGAALGRLMELEEQKERERLSVNAGYSFREHVDLLIALLAEARLLQKARASDGLT